MKIKGFKTYRHNTNPVEKQLHDSFVKELEFRNIDLLVYPPIKNSDTIPSEYLTDHDKQVMLSTIQWLGSPTGQSFLRKNGFELKQ